jgi:spore germination cell wall hydrolase CwlJ-like protein
MERRRRKKIRNRVLSIAILVIFTTALTAYGILSHGEESDASENYEEAQTVPEQTEFRATAGVAAVLEDYYTIPLVTTKTTDRSMDWDADESYLLAKIAMAEAEGEDVEGKALVICVVLNRVWSNEFPNTISEVLYQYDENSDVYQFTTLRPDGRFYSVEPSAECWQALYMVQVQKWDESQGALYFESTKDDDTWHSRNLEKLFVHGNHTFYTEGVSE